MERFAQSRTGLANARFAENCTGTRRVRSSARFAKDGTGTRRVRSSARFAQSRTGLASARFARDCSGWSRRSAKNVQIFNDEKNRHSFLLKSQSSLK
jgi:hypothetical protein